MWRGLDLLYRSCKPTDLTLTFPEDLTNDETLFNVPLGVQPVPDVKMARYAVNSGTRVCLLADVNLSQKFPAERLSNHTLAAAQY